MKILIFAGLSASGKSTISEKVGASLNIPRIDIQSFIHNSAKTAGFDRGRDWILNMGIVETLNQTRTNLITEIDKNRNLRDLINLNFHLTISVFFLLKQTDTIESTL